MARPKSNTAAQAHAWALMGFDLVTLRLVLAAAEERSFAGAALRENTSLSAVSRRIAEFEQRLGIFLFDRHDRGVNLTEAGTRFVDQLYELFDRLELIALDLEEIRGGVSGTVRISTPMTPVSGDLPAKIASFVDRHPGIDIQIVEETSTAALHGMATGTLDLILIPAASVPPGYTAIPWLDDELVVILPKDHPLLGKDKLKLKDLADEPFVTMGRESSLFSFYRQHMGAAGFRVKERAHATSFESVREMVSVGLGVAIVPATAATPYTDIMNLEVRRLDEAWAKRSHILCAHEPERRSVAAKLLIADLASSSPST